MPARITATTAATGTDISQNGAGIVPSTALFRLWDSLGGAGPGITEALVNCTVRYSSYYSRPNRVLYARGMQCVTAGKDLG